MRDLLHLSIRDTDVSYIFLAPPPRILHISSGISLPLGLPCSATLAPGH
jgi:hypothetical protein